MLARPRFWTCLLAALLVAASLAGCAADDGSGGGEGDGSFVDDPDATAGGDGAGGAGAGGGGDDGAWDDGSSDDTPEQRAADRFKAALERLSTEEGPDKYLFHMEAYSSAFGENLQTLYLDAPAGVTFFHIREGAGDEDELVGQSGKTYFRGDVNGTLRAVRDESAPAVTTQEEFATRYFSGEAPISGLSPYFSAHQALMSAGLIPGYAADEVETTKVGGVDVARMTFGETVVLMDPAMERILAVALVEDDYEGKRYANATFHYDDQAVHPWARALQRAETLAVHDPDEFGKVQIGRDGEASITLAVQPSSGDASVPLAEAEARVYDLRDDPGEDDPLLAVPLTQGEGANADLRVSFEDADGDGAVSRGDVLSYEVIRTGRDAGDYLVFLVDAQTGFHVYAS